MKMRTIIFFIFIGVTGLMLTSGAIAQDAANAEKTDTMTVVKEDQLPEEVDNQIKLPDGAAMQGVKNSEYGLETANQAREKHQEFGREKAREAQQEQIREQMRERAQDRVQDRAQERIQDRVPEQARERARDRIPDQLNE